MHGLARFGALACGFALGACTRHRPGESAPRRALSSSASSPAAVAPRSALAVGENADASSPRPPANPYPPDRVLSRFTPLVARHLRNVASRDPRASDDVFVKVGDSITASRHFLDCFAGPRVDLGVHAELASTLARFRAAPGDPFSCRSRSAGVGWSAWQAVEGRPSPLARETSALNPRFAFVMFGTNDVENDNIHRFARALSDIVRRLSARGVIPILWTVPRRLDQREKDLRVDRYNALVRRLAEARHVPLVDYHLALSSLPHDGLGHDGIHPSVEPVARGGACDLSARGLRYGYNLRNLLALEALAGAVQALGPSAAVDRDR